MVARPSGFLLSLLIYTIGIQKGEKMKEKLEEGQTTETALLASCKEPKAITIGANERVVDRSVL